MNVSKASRIHSRGSLDGWTGVGIPTAPWLNVYGVRRWSDRSNEGEGGGATLHMHS
jgi:hypothetical protein